LADERSVYIPPFGKGIIPHDAANFHRQNCSKIFEKALANASLKMENIDIITYAAGAGLPPCLLVGAEFAIGLSKKYKKPLVQVCHQVGHLEIGKLMTNTKDPVFLYLSGGNTQVIAFTGGRYRVFGETQDIPIGNAIDTLAREVGIPPPYGPNFDEVAKMGEYIPLPYVVKGMDMSFTGILTHVIKKFNEGVKKEDICYSFQETCFAMLTEVTERALAHTNKDEVLLVGGVAASKRLQEMVRIMCKERGAKMYVVPQKYAQDNGVQIAWVGILAYQSGWKDLNIQRSKINSKWRTDDVEITWIENKC
jgi:glycoprotease/Kae1 family metallohydrolase